MKLFGFQINREKRGVPSNPSSQVPDAVVGTGGVGLTSLLHGATNGAPMSISAVYCAVSIISNSIASIPIQVRKENSDGFQEVDYKHPLYTIMENNAGQHTQFEMIKYAIQSVLLKGNGFIYLYRDNTGKVADMRWLPSDMVSVVYNTLSNELYYLSPLVSKKKIEPVNMIHLKINSDDGIMGRSVISYAARSLKNANATENSAVNFYDSGCNLNGIIKVQGSLTPQQKNDIRDSWRESMNGNGLAVLQGNMDYTPIQMNVSDAQLIESRQFNVNDIARFFHINPTLLGDLTNSSYNTLEAAQEEFLVHTLLPYITIFEQEMNRKIWTPTEKKMGWNVNMDESSILRTDKKSQSEYYTKLLEKGVLSVNEVRKALGYAEIEGGDKHIVMYSDPDQNSIEDENPNEEQINE